MKTVDSFRSYAAMLPERGLAARALRRLTFACAASASFAVFAQSMPPMPPMDHGKMRMPPAASADPVNAAKTGPYPRNPDGTYAIPGDGMEMSDNAVFSMVMLDRLEGFDGLDSSGLNMDGSVWIGTDFNKLWLKAEAERSAGQSSGRAEVLWSHAVAAFWDLQTGVRHDFGGGPSRQWAVLGVQGITPYWFNVEAAVYVGAAGRTAARARGEYTVRITQRAILTPEVEVNAYGKSDLARGIGTGFSDARLGLRLRYEIRREFAPYIGITWARKLGQTATLARQQNAARSERQIVAGVRLWF